MKMAQMQEDTLAYWRSVSRKCDDKIPARRNMQEQHLGRIMAHVIIADVLSAPLDFKYRLVGTHLVDYLNADYTGKCLSELEGKGPDSKLWQLMEHVLKIQRPIFCNIPYVGPKSDFMRVATLYLPLASDHQTIDKIMAVPNFETRINPETLEIKEDEFTILEL